MSLLTENDILAWFNSYLRSRMDFLADIATGQPVMEVSKMLLADVISGMDRNRILMRHISGVNEFNYTLQLRDCRDCTHEGECPKDSDCDPITVASGKDIPVSMPNDILGFHAVYIIIENVIRNTAKHSGECKGQVIFTLEVRKCPTDNSLYQVWLYDNCPKSQSEVNLTEEDRNNYEAKTGEKAPQTMSEIELLVFTQNFHIDSEVLAPDTNALRHGAWGMIEMKACAAYLRKLPAESVDNKEYKLQFAPNKTEYRFSTPNSGTEKRTPNILKATHKNNSLAYVFHIMKPKEVIVVDEQGTLYEELAQNEDGSGKSKLAVLKEYGIEVLHTNAHKEQSDRFEENKNYAHPFMLVLPANKFKEETYLKKDDLFKGNLPTRILVKGQDHSYKENRWVARFDDNDEIISSIKAIKVTRNHPLTDDHIMDKIWKVWLKNRMMCFGIDAFITDNGTKPFNTNKGIVENFKNYIINNDQNQCNSFNIFIDHHGDNLKHIFSDQTCHFDHYEAYPSFVKPIVDKSTNDELDKNQPNPNFSKTELCKIIDGTLSVILMVDERVQQAYQSDYNAEGGDTIKKEILYKSANIHTPKENLNTIEEITKKNIIDQVRILRETGRLKGIDYIVIHLGIIEKMLIAAKKEKQVNDVINELAKESEARIIITSGRGKPDNLPKEVPFIAYSVISQYAIEAPFKSFLDQAIKSARLLT